MQNGERTLRILARPFHKYLHLDPGVTDIIMNRPCEVAVESRGIWSWHHEPALTFDRLDAMAILAGALMGKDIDETCPILDTHIPMQLDAADEPTKCRLAISARTRRNPATSSWRCGGRPRTRDPSGMTISGRFSPRRTSRARTGGRPTSTCCISIATAGSMNSCRRRCRRGERSAGSGGPVPARPICCAGCWRKSPSTSAS